jgi:hypothetical protein
MGQAPRRRKAILEIRISNSLPGGQNHLVSPRSGTHGGA